MELVHQVLCNQVRDLEHVQWIAKDWHIDLITDKMEVFKDLSVDLNEDDLFVNVGCIDRDWIVLWIGWLRSQDQENLLLDFVQRRRVIQEHELVRTHRKGKQEHVHAVGAEEVVDRFAIG